MLQKPLLKPIAANKNSWALWTKLFLIIGEPLTIVLAEQGSVCTVVNATCRAEWTLLGKLSSATEDHRTKQAGLRKGLLRWDLICLVWVLGDHVSEVLQTIGMILLIIIIRIYLVRCVLAQALSACSYSQPLTAKQVRSLGMEHRKSNEDSGWPKECEPEVMTCDWIPESAKKKKVITCEYWQKSATLENF